MSQTKFNLIENPNVTNRDILARITGQRRYTSDIGAADIGAGSIVYMGILQAPYPSARVTKLDVSKAQAAGFVTLTSSDLPAYNYYAGGRSWTPLVSDTVIYAGQPIAAVCASTPSGVEDALSLIDVVYEAQPYVMDIEDALAPGALQIWEGGNSLLPAPETASAGDISAGFAQSDEVVERTFNAGFWQHMNMEPVSTMAWWDNGVLNVWSQSSYAFSDQSTLASYFGLPLSDVVVKVGMGGTTNSATGTIAGNSVTGDYEIIAAVLSKKVGAPVKYVPTRPNTVLASTARFPMRGYVKIGGTKSGQIVALQVNLYYDYGARGGAFIDGNDDFYHPYVIPNFEVNVYAGNTNSYSQGAPMRDVGESQGHFMMESAVDELAQKLGSDPITFRLNNMRTKTNQPVDPTTQVPYSDLAEPDTFNMGVSAFNWSSMWKGWTTPSSTNGAKRRGVGVAYMSSNKGSMFPPCTAQVQVNTDGSVILYDGHSDHGAGTTTAIPIIGTEALGLTSFDNVTYISGDTSQTTDSSVTAGSQGTVNGGIGMMAAVQSLQAQWFPIVAAALAPGTKASNLAFGNNTIYDTTNPSNSISFKDAAALLKQPLTGSGNGMPNFLARMAKTFRVTGAKFAEVEVNTETGQVSVVNSVSALDLGRIVWYKGAYAQNEGGFIGMGIGEALYEEHINDTTTGLERSGSYLNPSFLDEKIPTIMETPQTHTPLFNESVDPMGPYGAKGIGEPCLVATSAAIANAISNALGGYRFSKLPIRREDVVNAIQTQQAAGLI